MTVIKTFSNVAPICIPYFNFWSSVYSWLNPCPYSSLWSDKALSAWNFFLSFLLFLPEKLLYLSFSLSRPRLSLGMSVTLP